MLVIIGINVGTVTAGTFRVFTKGDIGTEPPDVRLIIGSFPKPFINAAFSQFAISEFTGVLNAE
ncbi:MAG: hypothetical protein CM1200mP1_09730 [Candidatus Neomarinimicrobiota bacterium]|nr:MAG: hypothetical protein CM1200mP1_09730 [Candidatus Neomarinimicrobiota bacterium]